jgi:2-keto-4-pentenoate hydratase/2-oxohepta-3-ene-1,7-dioic acid hydratase in catechol pathway
MKLLTYMDERGDAVLGVLSGANHVLNLTESAARSGLKNTDRDMFASMQALIEAGEQGLRQAAALLQGAAVRDLRTLAELRLLAPLPVPQQMRDCLVFEKHLKQGSARYFRELADKAPDSEKAWSEFIAAGLMKIPDVWYKQPIYYKCNRFNVIGHDQDVLWPSYSKHLDYELELALVVGKKAKNIQRAEADKYIFGFTIFNDISARDAQFLEMPGRLGPAKGKDFDTGNILGPWIVTADEIDPHNLTMIARVNGVEWSRGHSSEMHHRFDAILEHISREETLYPGEVIGSGTVGGGCGHELGRSLHPGDVVELEIENIGFLRNRIVGPPTT